MAHAFERALERERVRNDRQIAAFRFFGAASLLIISLVSARFTEGWVGAPPATMAVYATLAAVVWWSARRDAEPGRWSRAALPFIDVPTAYALGAPAVFGLRDAGAPFDAAAAALLVSVAYGAFLFLAYLSLDAGLIAATGVSALAFQTLLIVQSGRDLTFVVQVDTLTAFTIAVAFYARSRTVALIGEASAEQLRSERLGRYFSPEVAAVVAADDADIAHGETREVSILFADLRDFTAISETMDGKAVVALLTEFHTCMVERLFEHGGTLDKYLGDGLMAYFGAPVAQPDHALRAVRCALAMQAELGRLGERLALGGGPRLRMGVGIHTGTVILGDVGAPRRREYTAVGDAVNVAARIEQLTKTLGRPVLVSEATAHACADAVAFGEAEPASVKGKRDPLRVFAPTATGA